MIKANELRIGNQIYRKNSDNIYEPIYVSTGEISWCRADEEDFNKIHSVIPLTEEWLKKFKMGVVEYPNKPMKKYFIDSDYFSIDTYNYSYTDNHRADFTKVSVKLNIKGAEYGELDLTNEVQYVHQLQNLVFALSGQELELK